MRGLCCVVGGCALLACGQHSDRPPYLTISSAQSTGGAAPIDTSVDDCALPPQVDAGLCGNVVIPTQLDRPNLYFVVDVSGSMADPFTSASATEKYTAARAAITGVLQLIGHRVSYGAAVFPNPDVADENCAPGKEIFATRAGDSVTCSITGQVGTVLSKLSRSLKNITPSGGTPLSDTLAALYSTLTALPGKTAVIVATDGAPNCNAKATCTPEFCQTNLIAYQYQSGLICLAPVNCCDASVVPAGPTNCIDNEATNQQISRLLAAGIATYVIGLPGESLSSAVLDSMAVAGGTARATSPRYYEADDAQSLAATLQKIATALAVSCTIPLAEAPPNWGQVAVYFDTELIPADAWQPVDAKSLQITGAYCDRLMTGNVFQVQVVADCPTYIY